MSHRKNQSINYRHLIRYSEGPVTLGYGLTWSHAEGTKAPHRESAPVSL